MDGFLLLDLNPNLFERVLTKVESEDYFGLQRTCREMNQRILSSRNISVRVDENYHVLFKGSKIYFYEMENGIMKKVPSFYGTRIRELILSYDGSISSEIFNRLCKILKNNQITCVQLGVEGTQMSMENGVRFMNILKPEKISIDSSGSQGYEALFQSKTLKNIKISLNEEDIKPVVPKLLSHFPTASVHVFNILTDDNEPRYNLLRTVVQILYTAPFPNLRRFAFCVTWNMKPSNYNLPTSEELHKIFPGCHLMPQRHIRQRNLYSSCIFADLPPHFPRESLLKITIEDRGFTLATIDFRSTATF